MADEVLGDDGVAAPRPKRRRQPAMADVARLAGVSHQTVSRVINGSERVAPATRDRVQAAMRLLDYRPNSMARALVTGRSRTVGVIGFNTTLFGPASTLYGIEGSAHEAEYLTSVVSMPEVNRDSVLLAVERLRRHNVEGVLLLASESSAIAALAPVSRELPLVALEAEPIHGIPTVTIDQYGGAVSATRHLLELGHRRIAHIAGPAGSLEAQLRLAGCRDTLAEAGHRLPAGTGFGDWSAGSGYEICVRLLEQDPDVTAIFVANDQMALGALRALDEAGRRVPADVSIVGFDAVPESGFFTPPLTTIHQDFVAIGRRGFEALRDRIENGDGPATHQVLEFELLVRASTGPPPAGA
ncbi:MAG TPA: LacI family DNA-binding transcriptional regulator [Solirubrobacteraceae bacterium]|nr:LacI family DNA-binding transcriptional regulator [Solirubrobacteraceae bacterium]